MLTDRGLEAAISALADHSAIPVTVTADVPERPAASVETAAYFVAAEALTNAAKHGEATRIEVRIVRRPKSLVLEVTDDGRGGADPAGAGLTGLRRRVEALDGTLLIVSASDGDHAPRRAAVRVLIAEDLALLRDGLVRLLRDNGFTVVDAVADGDALDPCGAPGAARHRDRRHPPAAELPRRGPARRARVTANRA